MNLRDLFYNYHHPQVNKLKSKEVRASQVMSNDLLRMSMKLETLTTGEIYDNL